MRARTVVRALALALAVFAAWGLHSETGRHAFDEMAGMIPFAAALLSSLLFALLLLDWAWRFLRRR
ncbi:hypothetical protein BH10PSE13_BH10PSE13_14640 [soil metagenome]